MLNKLKLIALSGTVLAGMTTAAQADPISAIALTSIGLSASTIGATAFSIATSALTLTMSLGLSLVSSMLNRPKKPVGGGTAGKLQAGGTLPRSIPLGRTVVTHSLVYANSDGRVSKTPNAVLTQVFSLADVPVRGLAEIWVNGSKVTWTATVGTQNAGGAYGYGIEIAEYPLHLFVKFYDGTQTAADSNLVSRFGSHPTRPYGSDRIGTGIAYAIVSCVVNSKYFSGFPQFKFVVDGAPLYDPRQDTTAGGSGSQRWTDKSTWSAAPSNPMVQAYNLLRGMSYGSQWLYGGQTIGAPQLPISAWAAAMNECDVAIPLAAGGSEPQFTSAMELRFDEPPIDALRKLLSASNGRIGERGGLFKPKVGAATSAVFSITDEDILSDASSTFDPFRSLDAIVNGVTGKYIEPREGWNAKDAPSIYTPALEAIDGGRRQTADLSFDAVTSAVQVQRLMTAALADARRERSHKLPLPPDAYVLEPTDTISWTSARNGYVNKLFEIKSTRDLGGLLTGVSLSEVDPADYSWSISNERAVALSSTAPFVVPTQPIVDWNASAVTVTGTDGSQLPGIRMTWDGTVEDIDGIQFEVWDDAQTSLIYEGSTDRYEIGAIVITANLRPSTAYKVRGRYRPVSSRPVSWSGYISVTTPAVQLVGPASIDITRLSTALQTTIAGTGPGTVPGVQQAIDNFRRSLDPTESVRSLAGEPVLANIRREIDQLSETMAAVQARFEQLRAANIEAGLEIDSEEGRARIYAVAALTSDTTRRFNDVSVSISALDARVSLIASTVVSGDFSALVTQISTVRVDLDALSASLSNYVRTATFTPVQAEVTILRADLTTANAAITLRATQTALDSATTRITNAETTISALGNIISSVSAVTQAADIDLTNQTLAQVLALLAANKDATVTEFANATNQIGARIDENGNAIATARLELTALTTSTAAGFLSEQTARASAVDALTTSINSLTAIVNNPTTGLAATKALVDSTAGTLATTTSAQATTNSTLSAAAAAAQSTATSAASAAATADGKAVAADSKAVTALSNAATADGKAVAAQATADSASSAAASAASAASTLSSRVNAVFGANVADALLYVGSFADGTGAASTFTLSARATVGGTPQEVGITGFVGSAGRGIELGGSGATVRIRAAQVQLVDASVNGGVPVTMFSIAGGKFVFNPLTEIVTDNIRASSVTDRQAARVTTASTLTNNASLWSDVSATVNVTTTSTDFVSVFGQASADVNIATSIGGTLSVTVRYRIVRVTSGSTTVLLPDDSGVNGKVLLQGSASVGSGGSLVGNDHAQFSLQDQPGAGTHTYRIEISASWTGSNSGAAQIRVRSINANVVKR